MREVQELLAYPAEWGIQTNRIIDFEVTEIYAIIKDILCPYGFGRYMNIVFSHLRFRTLSEVERHILIIVSAWH